MATRGNALGAIVLGSFCLCFSSSGAEWIRAGVNAKQPHWGLPGGLQFALYPGGFGPGDGGPRGLIRVGAPVLPEGRYALVNFIAVEPIVHGVRGLSELEFSRLDHVKGKRFWAPALGEPGAAPALNPGRLWEPEAGVTQLDVPVNVEAFDNGAHVHLVISQRSDAPDEIRLTVRTQPGSAPLEKCILTATMGNMVRTRLLWLKDEVLSSLELYPRFRGTDFAPHTLCPLKRLAHHPNGDVIVAITGNEADPASVFPFPGTRQWYYPGCPVTQYWKMAREQVHPDLHAAVNARYTYWQSQRPVPGGIAFENFELQTRFAEGQQLIFGITRRTPQELGIRGRGAP